MQLGYKLVYKSVVDNKKEQSSLKPKLSFEIKKLVRLTDFLKNSSKSEETFFEEFKSYNDRHVQELTVSVAPYYKAWETYVCGKNTCTIPELLEHSLRKINSEREKYKI